MIIKFSSIIFISALYSLAFSSDSSMVAAPTECGKYKINGVVRASGLSNPVSVLVVNEKTQSEHTLSFASSDEALKQMIYLNKDVTLTVLLNKKFNGTSGELSFIENIESRIPNPLSARDTGFILLEKKVCKI